MQLLALGSWYGVIKPFKDMFDHAEELMEGPDVITQVKAKVTKDTVLLFGGGEDIDPKIYGETPHNTTQKTYRHSSRDHMETEAFNIGRYVGAKMLGICRGAQLLCALSGGRLIQHVNGHFGDHEIITDTGEVYTTSSVHHQMMFPFKAKYKLIAWSKNPLSQFYWANNKQQFSSMEIEPEIVFFPESNALAIQGHPEFMNNQEPFVAYCRELVKEYLLK